MSADKRQNFYELKLRQQDISIENYKSLLISRDAHINYINKAVFNKIQKTLKSFLDVSLSDEQEIQNIITIVQYAIESLNDDSVIQKFVELSESNKSILTSYKILKEHYHVLYEFSLQQYVQLQNFQYENSHLQHEQLSLQDCQKQLQNEVKSQLEELSQMSKELKAEKYNNKLHMKQSRSQLKAAEIEKQSEVQSVVSRLNSEIQALKSELDAKAVDADQQIKKQSVFQEQFAQRTKQMELEYQEQLEIERQIQSKLKIVCQQELQESQAAMDTKVKQHEDEIQSLSADWEAEKQSLQKFQQQEIAQMQKMQENSILNSENELKFADDKLQFQQKAHKEKLENLLCKIAQLQEQSDLEKQNYLQSTIELDSRIKSVQGLLDHQGAETARVSELLEIVKLEQQNLLESKAAVLHKLQAAEQESQFQHENLQNLALKYDNAIKEKEGLMIENCQLVDEIKQIEKSCHKLVQAGQQKVLQIQEETQQFLTQMQLNFDAMRQEHAKINEQRLLQHSEQADQLTGHIKTQKIEFEAGIAALKAEHATNMQAAKEDQECKNSVVHDLQNSITLLENQLKTCQQDLIKREQEYETSITQSTNFKNQTIQLKDYIQDLIKQNEDQGTQYIQKYQNARNDFEKHIAQLDENYHLDRDNLIDSHESVVHNMQQQYTNLLNELQKEITTAKTAIAEREISFQEQEKTLRNLMATQQQESDEALSQSRSKLLQAQTLLDEHTRQICEIQIQAEVQSKLLQQKETQLQQEQGNIETIKKAYNQQAEEQSVQNQIDKNKFNDMKSQLETKLDMEIQSRLALIESQHSIENELNTQIVQIREMRQLDNQEFEQQKQELLLQIKKANDQNQAQRIELSEQQQAAHQAHKEAEDKLMGELTLAKTSLLNIQEQLYQQLQVSQENFQAELEKLKNLNTITISELTDAHQTNILALKQDHEFVLQNTVGLHESVVHNMQQQHTNLLNELQKEITTAKTAIAEREISFQEQEKTLRNLMATQQQESDEALSQSRSKLLQAQTLLDEHTRQICEIQIQAEVQSKLLQQKETQLQQEQGNIETIKKAYNQQAEEQSVQNQIDKNKFNDMKSQLETKLDMEIQSRLALIESQHSIENELNTQIVQIREMRQLDNQEFEQQKQELLLQIKKANDQNQAQRIELSEQQQAAHQAHKEAEDKLMGELTLAKTSLLNIQEQLYQQLQVSQENFQAELEKLKNLNTITISELTDAHQTNILALKQDHEFVLQNTVGLHESVVHNMQQQHTNLLNELQKEITTAKTAIAEREISFQEQEKTLRNLMATQQQESDEALSQSRSKLLQAQTLLDEHTRQICEIQIQAEVQSKLLQQKETQLQQEQGNIETIKKAYNQQAEEQSVQNQIDKNKFNDMKSQLETKLDMEIQSRLALIESQHSIENELNTQIVQIREMRQLDNQEFEQQKQELLLQIKKANDQNQAQRIELSEQQQAAHQAHKEAEDKLMGELTLAKTSLLNIQEQLYQQLQVSQENFQAELEKLKNLNTITISELTDAHQTNILALKQDHEFVLQNTVGLHESVVHNMQQQHTNLLNELQKEITTAKTAIAEREISFQEQEKTLRNLMATQQQESDEALSQSRSKLLQAQTLLDEHTRQICEIQIQAEVQSKLLQQKETQLQQEQGNIETIKKAYNQQAEEQSVQNQIDKNKFNDMKSQLETKLDMEIQSRLALIESQHSIENELNTQIVQIREMRQLDNQEFEQQKQELLLQIKKANDQNQAQRIELSEQQQAAHQAHKEAEDKLMGELTLAKTSLLNIQEQLYQQLQVSQENFQAELEKLKNLNTITISELTDAHQTNILALKQDHEFVLQNTVGLHESVVHNMQQQHTNLLNELQKEITTAKTAIAEREISFQEQEKTLRNLMATQQQESDEALSQSRSKLLQAQTLLDEHTRQICEIQIQAEVQSKLLQQKETQLQQEQGNIETIKKAYNQQAEEQSVQNQIDKNKFNDMKSQLETKLDMEIQSRLALIESQHSIENELNTQIVQIREMRQLDNQEFEQQKQELLLQIKKANDQNQAQRIELSEQQQAAHQAHKEAEDKLMGELTLAKTSLLNIQEQLYQQLQVSQENFQAELEKLKNLNTITISELIDAHQTNILALKQDHEFVLQNTVGLHESVVHNMQQQHTNLLNELQKEITTAKTAIAEREISFQEQEKTLRNLMATQQQESDEALSQSRSKLLQAQTLLDEHTRQICEIQIQAEVQSKLLQQKETQLQQEQGNIETIKKAYNQQAEEQSVQNQIDKNKFNDMKSQLETKLDMEIQSRLALIESQHSIENELNTQIVQIREMRQLDNQEFEQQKQELLLQIKKANDQNQAQRIELSEQQQAAHQAHKEAEDKLMGELTLAKTSLLNIQEQLYQQLQVSQENFQAELEKLKNLNTITISELTDAHQTNILALKQDHEFVLQNTVGLHESVVHNMQQQHTNLLNELQKQITTAKTAIAEREISFQEQEKTLRNLMATQQQESEKIIASVQESKDSAIEDILSSKNSELDLLNQNLQNQENANSILKDQVQQLQTQNDTFQEEIFSLENQLAHQQNQHILLINQLQQEISDAKLSMEAQDASKSKEIQDIKSAQEAQIVVLNENVDKLKADLAAQITLISENDTLKRELHSTKLELNESMQSSQMLTSQHREMSVKDMEIAQLNQQINNLSSQNMILQSQINAKKDELNSKLLTAMTQNSIYAEQMKNYEMQLKKIKAQGQNQSQIDITKIQEIIANTDVIFEDVNVLTVIRYVFFSKKIIKQNKIANLANQLKDDFTTFLMSDNTQIRIESGMRFFAYIYRFFCSDFPENEAMKFAMDYDICLTYTGQEFGIQARQKLLETVNKLQRKLKDFEGK
ncbi:hypothetical protein SS50377_24030 [Spironucleus salmonicida]|uniref:Uncharacterized protein n=1 Tax=Spironucleus salmonicida TaxID=348837 RepID=A0A9P8RYR7_9EUKA|nr:hypothetical protein SS50377_24030 [Spironucleus salmonicida]